MTMRSLPFLATLLLIPCLLSSVAAQEVGQQPAAAASPVLAENPYRLQPFHGDFPAKLEYPNRHNVEYDRTRRQVLERIVANLQGAGRRETWQTATEFFWDGPEEIVEPLIEAMDRHFGDPSMKDMVRNCVEAMGRMSDPAFDEALRRALEHKNDAVRQSAFGALAHSSSDDTLRAMHTLFPQMGARARQAWLGAVRVRLGDEAVKIFRGLMLADTPAHVRDQVLQETLKLPAAQATVVLRGLWGDATGEFKAVIAGVLHAADDTSGTTWLLDVLRGEDLAMLPLAVRHSLFTTSATVTSPGRIRDALLALSSHPRPQIRFELAKVLSKVEGEDIASVYELLSHPDEPWEIKSLALRELTRRGHNVAATALLEELATAQGTRLQVVLSMLGATGDERAVPIFVERFKKAPPGEGRPFLQSLAVLGCRSAAAALVELFAGPDILVDRNGSGRRLSTRTYIPLLLLNLRGCADVVFDAYVELSVEDWYRKSLLLPTVLGMATDNNDKELLAQALPLVRKTLFDRDELPQLRVQALNLLARSHLTIDDVMRLKNRRFDEQPGMRALWNDLLHDLF